MNGLIVDKKAVEQAVYEMRLNISRGYNASDIGLKYMSFCRAQGIFQTLVTLDLLTDIQKNNYDLDLKELEDNI